MPDSPLHDPLDDPIQADSGHPAWADADRGQGLTVAHGPVADRVFPGRSWLSVQQRNALRHLIRDECLPSRQQRPTLLLMGEPGVGKCTIAKVLHEASPRGQLPLRIVRCEGLTVADLAHLLADPAPASLVLRGVEHLSIAAQGWLLAWLTRAAESVAGTLRVPATRLISTSSTRLEGFVFDSLFNAELLRRLSGDRMVISPLRERGDDVALMATRCLQELAPTLNPAVTHLTRQALTLLGAHGWPGNLRELRLAIERALLFCRTDALDANDFDLSALQIAAPRGAQADDLAPTLARLTGPRRTRVAGDGPTTTLRAPTAERAWIDLARLGGPPRAHTRIRLDTQTLWQSLQRCDWNVSRTAQMLDISHNALRYQIAKHGLRRQKTFLLPTLPATDPDIDASQPGGSTHPW